MLLYAWWLWLPLVLFYHLTALKVNWGMFISWHFISLKYVLHFKSIWIYKLWFISVMKMHHNFYTLDITDHLDFILTTQCAVIETSSFRPVRLSPHTKAEPGSNMYFRTISENGQCTRYKNRLNRDVMQILHNIKCSFTAPTVKGSIWSSQQKFPLSFHE